MRKPLLTLPPRKLVLVSSTTNIFQGPRDWSPRIGLVKGVLKALKTEVPALFLAGVKELRKAGYQEIALLVQRGFAFVLKIYREYHVVCIASDGTILMSPRAKEALRVFDDWSDGIPKGFRYEIVKRPSGGNR